MYVHTHCVFVRHNPGHDIKLCSAQRGNLGDGCVCMCVWTHFDIAHICLGCVSVAVTAHVSAVGLGSDVKVCVKVCVYLVSILLIWGEHLSESHLCISFWASWLMCVCFYVCVLFLSHTLCSHKPSLGVFTSILPSFIFPPWDGKLLLSLVQLMPHTPQSPPVPFLFVCVSVRQGPWHRSGLRRLSDSSDSTVRAFFALTATFSLQLQGKKQQKRRGRDSGGKKREISGLVQVGSLQQWRGEGSHLSCIKLCKVGVGESGRLRSDRAGNEDGHVDSPVKMFSCVPIILQLAINILRYLHARLSFSSLLLLIGP